MEPNVKAPVFRILSGPPAKVEAEVNLLSSHYSMTTYFFAVVKDEIIVTCFMLHESEIEKMRREQLAGALTAVPVDPRLLRRN